jgi:cell division protein FtsI/penicillin-binding protein 2
VARGSWSQPALFPTLPAGAPAPNPDQAPPPANGTALRPASVAALRAMMREVVTAGTATALGDVPGGQVQVKTGTAEYDNNPAHTHAWTIGYRATSFAVFVDRRFQLNTAVPSSFHAASPSPTPAPPFAPIMALRPRSAPKTTVSP